MARFTRRAHDHALTGICAWYGAGEHGAFSKFVVEAYRMHLAAADDLASSVL